MTRGKLGSPKYTPGYRPRAIKALMGIRRAISGLEEVREVVGMRADTAAKLRDGLIELAARLQDYGKITPQDFAAIELDILHLTAED